MREQEKDHLGADAAEVDAARSAESEVTGKHTPGPWDDASNYPELASVRIFAGSHYIATVGNSDDLKAQTEANARLIAAAPELLDALKQAHAQLARMSHPDTRWEDPLMVSIRFAIAKAEGREATGGNQVSTEVSVATSASAAQENRSTQKNAGPQ